MTKIKDEYDFLGRFSQSLETHLGVGDHELVINVYKNLVNGYFGKNGIPDITAGLIDRLTEDPLNLRDGENTAYAVADIFAQKMVQTNERPEYAAKVIESCIRHARNTPSWGTEILTTAVRMDPYAADPMRELALLGPKFGDPLLAEATQHIALNERREAAIVNAPAPAPLA